MKRIKFLVLPIFIILFIACSKDDDGSSKEDFLTGYLSQTQFDEETDEVIDFANDFEFGVEFRPTVNGEITEIKVKLPAERNDLRITLWNKSDMSVLSTETLNISTAGETMVFDIEDIELNGGDEYAITMNSNDWYYREGTEENDANYPVTIGNIDVLAYIIENTSDQIYPTMSILNSYSGDLSFNFQRTE